jgi:hypothetical protein
VEKEDNLRDLKGIMLKRDAKNTHLPPWQKLTENYLTEGKLA